MFLAVARVAGERSDVDNVDVGGGGEDKAFEKRFLKLWTYNGGGANEEEHLKWYGDADEYDEDEEEVDGALAVHRRQRRRGTS